MNGAGQVLSLEVAIPFGLAELRAVDKRLANDQPEDADVRLRSCRPLLVLHHWFRFVSAPGSMADMWLNAGVGGIFRPAALSPGNWFAPAGRWDEKVDPRSRMALSYR